MYEGYFRLYADPEEPGDSGLIKLFKESGLRGCCISYRRPLDQPELIREFPAMDIRGERKIQQFLILAKK